MKNLEQYGVYIKGNIAYFEEGVLSNEWHNGQIKIDGVFYDSVIQYMLAAKADTLNDIETFNNIMTNKDVSKFKTLDKQMKTQTKEWDQMFYDVLKKGLYCKFDQNSFAQRILFETDNLLLVNCGKFNDVYGNGLCFSDAHMINPMHWTGKNLLGLALMEVRSIFQNEEFE
jgi:ribA/ribD-fused uncharacterized protein